MKAPLRKIVRRFWGGQNGNLPMEELECGHTQMQKQDIIGPTNAYRRRCKKCGKATEGG